ncbi:MAG: accessory Sec system translocase SecA2 [Clostridia bacterium]|nr:accessory Sec system translocase SecA2 [Clostridia bacterium]
MVNRNNIEYDLKPLNKTLCSIKKFYTEGYENEQIKSASQALKRRAEDGENCQELLPEAFALVNTAVKKALGITPHDVQLLAAIAMAQGQIIELPTGEGKTLVAVFTAYLMSLTGEGVQVLTVNDYLAQRDALWMKPVYDLLEVSVSYITELTDRAERRLAYASDVCYITAKEAGFDYLRSFLAYDTASVVQRPFNFAVVDEVDSILIDEARIPLVISGNEVSTLEIDKRIYEAVKKMQRGVDFNTDEHESSIYLDETGIISLEDSLGLGDIYEDRNLAVIEKAEAILQAEYLLKRDVDYIVKDNEVLIIDKYTGRIAINRQWTDELQTAVELKEGLTQKAKGEIMNSITLSNFLSLYKGFCGMTGTARSAGAEFLKFYNKSVTVIPPNKPCIRVDHRDYIFATKQDKYRAIVEEVKKVNVTGQPILIGTCSIEESELLADMLRESISQMCVLNAKQDAEEARIIADAGMLGAVTISTNMAGRGVDIALGGANAQRAEEVRALGGLYVIGTNRHESRRIDNQLRGRAGRQGDPGKSRFFISLTDDLVVKYGLSEVIPEKYKNVSDNGPLQNKELAKAVIRTQKIVEVQTFDAKTTLSKYSRIVEEQRRLVYKKREDILFERIRLSLLEKERPERFEELLAEVSESEFLRAQKQIELYAINKCWSEHLLYIESVMDEIKMISVTKGNPHAYYNQKLTDGFDSLQKHIYELVLGVFDSVVIKEGLIDLEEMNIVGPTATKTYLVHDGSELQNFLGGSSAIGAMAFAAPLFFVQLLVDKLRLHRKNSR